MRGFGVAESRPNTAIVLNYVGIDGFLCLALQCQAFINHGTATP